MDIPTFQVFYINNDVSSVQANRTTTAWTNLSTQSVTIARGLSLEKARYRRASESEIYLTAETLDQLQNETSN